MLKELVARNRSYRRFYQDVPVSLDTLRELVDLARLAGSARNMQPLRYILSCDPAKNAVIFPTLSWAGYLKEWGGPKEGERPAAYIVMLGDKSISPSFSDDPGIAAQTLFLGAVEKGLGGCLIGSVKREVLAQELGIADTYQILYVLALGKPKEVVVIEPMPPSGDVKYWRDAQQVHHVPKRALNDLIISQF